LRRCNQHGRDSDGPLRRLLTDPPYNVDEGKTAKKLKIGNDTLGGKFYDFLRAACTNVLAVTKGAVYICMSSSELHTVHQAFTDADGYWSTFVIWAKHHFTLGRSDYQRQYEPILYGWRKGTDHFWCGARDQGDIWFIKRPASSQEHPTMKPVELVAQVIDGRLDAVMKTGIRRADIDLLENEIETANLDQSARKAVEEELEATRERQLDLRKQIDRLRGMLADSQKAIGLSQDHFRSAISCALQILGAEPLTSSANGVLKNSDCSVFPALDQRPGADPTWAETMDSLRAPRTRDQKFWDWRRTSPIRPVVFEDPGVVTEEVVQLRGQRHGSLQDRRPQRSGNDGRVHLRGTGTAERVDAANPGEARRGGQQTERQDGGTGATRTGHA
jgi:hypothetical protein